MNARSARSASRTLLRHAFTSARESSKPGYAASLACVASASILLLYNARRLECEALPAQVAAPTEMQAVAITDVMKTRGLVAWGDNSYRVAAPDSDSEKIKKPRAVNIFEDQALRHLALHRTHAAAVDARGNVWQWGAGFDPECKGPTRTLVGHDIVRVALTKHKVFALSRKGKVYVFAADGAVQKSRPPPRVPTSWWWPSFLPAGHAGIDVIELETPNAKFEKDERVADFAAGDHHVVARTNKGRILAAPATYWANRYGQLGTRHIVAAGNRLELIPHGFGPGDPHPHEPAEYQGLSAAYNIPAWWLDTAFAGAGRPVLLMREPDTGTAPGESKVERDPRFCTHLYEYKAMKDLDVVEVAAGARHNIARLRDGRVVGWGANDQGQLGLGPMYNFPVLPVPAEIPLFRAYEIFSGRELPTVECTSIAAGTETSYFIANRAEVRWIGERDAAPTKRIEHYVDVLACGQGRAGEIGDGQWLPRLYPTLLKNISSLREWSEARKAIVPIPVRSLSASTHVAAVLDNETTSDGTHGRDVFLFGSNYDYQLGTGKRNNNCLPSRLRLNTKGAGIAPTNTFSTSPLVAAPSDAKLDSMSLPYSRLQLGPPKKRGGHLAEETVIVGPGLCAIYHKIVEP